MIQLSRGFYERIVEEGKKAVPEEMCGLIGGTLKGGDKVVREIYFLENTDHSPEHFSMNPQEQLKAVKDMRSRGLVPLGNFHSHPESPARPSKEDQRLAYDKNASYMILFLMDKDRPVLKSFHIEDQVSSEEPLELMDS